MPFLKMFYAGKDSNSSWLKGRAWGESATCFAETWDGKKRIEGSNEIINFVRYSGSISWPLGRVQMALNDVVFFFENLDLNCVWWGRTRDLESGRTRVRGCHVSIFFQYLLKCLLWLICSFFFVWTPN